MVAVILAVDNDALVDVGDGDDRKLEAAVSSDEIECVGVKCKLRELQEKCLAKNRKVYTFFVEAFKLANELLSSVDAHMSMVERASRVNRGEEVKFEIMMDERDGSRKVLANLTLDHAES